MRSGRLRSIDYVRLSALSIFFLFLTLFIFRRLFEGACLTGTDSMSTIYGPTMQMTYGTYFSSWDYFSSAGFLAYPSPALAAINQLVLGFLNVSASDFAKIMLLGSFWLSGMISFYVIHSMVRSDLAAFIGSLVYVANGAFVNQIVEGHFGFIYAYPFLILIFFLFYEAYTKGIGKKTLILPLLLLAFGGSAAPHMVLLTALMIVGFMIFEILTSTLLKQSKNRLYKAALSISLVVLLTLPLAYVMFVLGDSSVLHTSYTIEEAAGGSSNLLTALSIGGSETTNTYGYYGVDGGQQLLAVAQILAFPLSIFAFLSVLVRKYWTLTIPVVAIIVMNMFMAMGPNQPLGGAFTYLFDNVPMVDSFRALSRFLLINAMFYSILIAITVSNWEEASRNLSKLTKSIARTITRGRTESALLEPSKALSATLVGLLVVSSLSGLFVLMNGEVIRSFDPPNEYAQPFEYVATLEPDGLSYKIFTLPMTTDIYQHPTIPSVSGYSYPKGTTLDPGTYLPIIIDKSPMAHSTSSINYWSGINTCLENRIYGYKDTLALLGSSAGVKYVIEQFYADEREKSTFSEMNDGSVLMTYESGARIIGVDQYSEAIKTQSGLVIGSGGLDMMYLLLGMDVFDPLNNTYASIGTLDSSSLDPLLAASSLIIIQNGDLFELAYDTGMMSRDLLPLIEGLNPQRGDQRGQWIIKVDSGAQETSVITSGDNNLTVHPNSAVQGPSTLMVRAMFGPDQGDLHVYVNGAMVSNTSLKAPYTGMDWISIGVPAGTERIASISFGGSGDTWPVEVSAAAIISNERRDQLRSGLETLFGPYSSKVGYAFTPLYIYNHDPDALLWYAPEGNGVMSLNRTSISVPFETLFDGSFRLSAFSPDWGARSVALDGHGLNATDLSSGAYRYDLPSVTNGTHEMEVFADGTYGVALLPDHELSMPMPEMSYQRVSPTEYHVSVRNASGPFFLKFSEGSSKFWTVQPSEGGSSIWFRADYLANGFLVNGTGDLELSLKFTKQGEYETFLSVYLVAIVASTAVISAAYLYCRRGGVPR